MEGFFLFCFSFFGALLLLFMTLFVILCAGDRLFILLLEIKDTYCYLHWAFSRWQKIGRY